MSNGSPRNRKWPGDPPFSGHRFKKSDHFGGYLDYSSKNGIDRKSICVAKFFGLKLMNKIFVKWAPRSRKWPGDP